MKKSNKNIEEFPLNLWYLKKNIEKKFKFTKAANLNENCLQYHRITIKTIFFKIWHLNGG